MELTVETLLKAALELSAEDRALLVDKLWDSLECDPERGLDRIWVAEAERRMSAHAAGRIASTPAEQVFLEIEREWDEEVERRLAEYNAGTAPTVPGAEVLRFLNEKIRKEW